MSDAQDRGLLSARAAESIVLQLAPLAELREWDRVASLVERIRDALAGVEGLDPRDMADARRLSEAWSGIPAEVRAFLVGLLTVRGSECVAARMALGNLLDGRPAALEPWARGALARSWRDSFGLDPVMSGVQLWR